MQNGHEESPPLLDLETLHYYQREIMSAVTREILDGLTIRIWRVYAGTQRNDAALQQLRAAIEAKRDILARNNPR